MGLSPCCAPFSPPHEGCGGSLWSGTKGVPVSVGRTCQSWLQSPRLRKSYPPGSERQGVMPAAPGCGLQSNTACIPAGQYLRAGLEARKKRREEREGNGCCGRNCVPPSSHGSGCDCFPLVTAFGAGAFREAIKGE